VFKKIKKQNGEGFAKAIRGYHGGIFEIPGILSIVKHAGRGRGAAESVIPYLMTLLNTSEAEVEEIADPFALLKKAGYEAYHADTLKKQNAIKRYFATGEELCTFSDATRFQNYYIVNCVHESVKTLQRKDFNGKEKRQDAYGVSVISIQIAKRGGFVSIKNRYNHVVANCDNTFQSNPDNIIQGLSKALQKHFSVSFEATHSLPDGYAMAGSQIVEVNQELSGIYIGNHCYIKDGALVEMKEHEYLFDYFIFNERTKTFRMIAGLEVSDSFPEDYNRVYGGRKSVFVKKHCIYDGSTKLVGV